MKHKGSDIVVSEIVSTSPTYTFTANKNRRLIAVFEKIPNYTITLDTYPNSFGTATGTGVYQDGKQATISATASEDYRFVYWVEDFEPPAPVETVIQISISDYSGDANATALINNFGELYIDGNHITNLESSIITTNQEIAISYKLIPKLATGRNVKVNDVSIGTVQLAGDTVSTTIATTDSLSIYFAQG